MLTNKADHQLTSKLGELDEISSEEDVSEETVHKYVVLPFTPL